MNVVATALIALQATGLSWETMTTADGLPALEIRVVLVAEDGGVWFGTRDDGVARFADGAWTYYRERGVADLFQTADGRIWATGGGGYSIFDGRDWTFHDNVGDRPTRVVFTAGQRPDRPEIWLGAIGFAARYADGAWAHFTQDDGIPHVAVHQAWPDRQGTVWFACRRGLAQHTSRETIVHYPDVNFRSILEDADGALWFGTSRGVLVHRNGDWSWHLEGQTVMPSAVDRHGAIWAHTEGDGVHRFDGDQWHAIRAADGLVSDVVYDVAVGADGAIWVATDGGVSVGRN